MFCIETTKVPVCRSRPVYVESSVASEHPVTHIYARVFHRATSLPTLETQQHVDYLYLKHTTKHSHFRHPRIDREFHQSARMAFTKWVFSGARRRQCTVTTEACTCALTTHLLSKVACPKKHYAVPWNRRAMIIHTMKQYYVRTTF